MTRVPKPAASINQQPRDDTNGTVVPPFVIVQKRVLSPTAPYTHKARLVALALASFLHSKPDDNGQYSAWPSHQTLAKCSGLSVASVKRALDELCEGDAPLFARTRAKATQRAGRLHGHESCRYTLVLAPAAFVAARDRARARNVERLVSDFHAEKIALQRQLRTFGGSLSEAEYQQRLTKLQRQAAPLPRLRKQAFR